jgi:hypothetical protein
MRDLGFFGAHMLTPTLFLQNFIVRSPARIHSRWFAQQLRNPNQRKGTYLDTPAETLFISLENKVFS